MLRHGIYLLHTTMFLFISLYYGKILFHNTLKNQCDYPILTLMNNVREKVDKYRKGIYYQYIS